MGNKPKKIIHTIASRIDELNHIDEITEQVSQQLALNLDQKNNLAIAVTEAVGNAIIHGNKNRPEKKVTVEFHIHKDKIEVFVKDQGKGFDPGSLADPLLPENLMKESGRGIFILNELMDDVSYDFSTHGTTLKMMMKLPAC